MSDLATIRMRMLHPAVQTSRGSSLPVAILLLALLGTIGAAIVEVTRFGNLASRAQVSLAAAMHLADTGLQAYVSGALDAVGPSRLVSSRGEGLVRGETILRLNDSSTIVRVTSSGSSPSAARPAGHRTLEALVHFDPAGNRRPIAGSLWEEY